MALRYFTPPKNAIIIQPQPGPQTQFLSTSADIAVYGGAAGGGKSYALLMEGARHINVPDYGGLIFRRTFTQIEIIGGLLDTAKKVYEPIGGVLVDNEFRFPAKSVVKFAHMEHEKTRLSYQGAQIPYIGFDELTHFSWEMFTYLLSRSRTVLPVRPVVRGTCNPDPDHWLRRFLAWWIDEDTGFAIHERSGIIRYFIIANNEVVWGDSPDDFVGRGYDPIEYIPKSFTFIPSSLDDNQILMKADPGYRANLMSQPRHVRDQLLYGNWNARPSAGSFFRKAQFEVLPAVPPGARRQVRAWDLAATAGGGDWTVGVKMSKLYDGRFVVEDVYREQIGAAKVKQTINNLASQDGVETWVRLPQDPGQAGKSQALDLTRGLGGYRVQVKTVSGSKATRAMPVSSQAEVGNIAIVRGPWNDAFLRELENFTGSGKNETDDQVDAFSDAFDSLNSAKTGGVF
ncbi:MAG: hypothetical protein BWK76_23080 [Desulfobulbaceae bacterium A2]|nr:MAG: hypothetical protein BWK76_23080 [Desulfobulbaceae bacterium A2]